MLFIVSSGEILQLVLFYGSPNLRTALRKKKSSKGSMYRRRSITPKTWTDTITQFNCTGDAYIQDMTDVQEENFD